MTLRRTAGPREVARGAAALGAALLLLLPACGGSGDAAPPAFSITRVGWYEENIDPSFWTTPPATSQAAFYDFFIHYEGDITYADLQSVRVYAPDGHFWNLLRNATALDTSAKIIGGWQRWYAGATNVLPLGSLRAQVTLADGRVFEATQAIAEPGSAVPGAFDSMHTEDVLAPPARSAPMVRRVAMGPDATIDTAAQSITLSFSTADPLAYSGWVWVYDAANTYLGGSRWFRDPVTDAVSPVLGGVLHTDGTANTVVLQAADVQLVAGATFSQIDRARVVVTDGAQYAAQTGFAYDCRSVGPVATLTRR